MKKLFYSMAIGAALFASACGNDDENGETTVPDFPIVGDFLLTGQCSDNPVRYATWVEGDKIGVFVFSEGQPQSNLCYEPKEVGAYDEATFDYTKDAGNVELVAAQKAGFKQGEHTIYAYYPYDAAAADVTAVPVPDVTVQDLSGEHPRMFADTKYVFGYAKATCSKYSTAAVDFGMFTSPVTKLNLNNLNFKDEMGGKTIKTVTIAGSDEPIGYKNPTFDLTEGKFGGEAAAVEVISGQKITEAGELFPGFSMPATTEEPFTIVLAIDFEKAMAQTYTLTVETADGVVVKAEGVEPKKDFSGDAIMISGPEFE